MPAVPTVIAETGWSFHNWDTELLSTIVTQNITYTAQYSINTFNVVFNDWDNTELKSEIVEYNKSATAPTDPIKTGYTFTNWDIDFNKITTDLIITAQYAVITQIDNIINIDAQIYPNPIVDLLNLNFSRNFDNNYVVKIYNSMGEIVLNRNIYSNKISINTSSWKADTYIIMVKSDSVIYKSKVIKL